MLSNYLTILIVPQKNGKVLRLKVSSFFFRLYLVIIVVLAVISIGIFVDYIIIKEKGKEFVALNKALMLQKFQMKEISNSLISEQELIKKYAEFDRKLRLISGLQDTNPVVAFDSQFYNEQPEQEMELDSSEKITRELEKLNMDIKLREISFFQLETYLQERKDRLARTPSISPTTGHLSSNFGKRVDPFTGKEKFHNGVDWSNRPYTPVYAPADGVVVNTFYNGGYGEFLVIDHGYNIVTRYGHLAKYLVQVGQKVKRGDLIARIGNSGRSTAPHLHYEVLVRDQHVDPEKYILD
ncbi:MAG: M23 family metallopeptidase [Deltaproteobacteria bacterium]|nr:M23 family metallopeptidase [Deltaproteobacteria bacterium]